MLSSNVSQLVHDYHEHDLFLKTSHDEIQTLETQLIQCHVFLERLQQDSSRYVFNQELLQKAKGCEEKIHRHERQDSLLQEQCLTLEKDLVHIQSQYDEWCCHSERFDEICQRLDYLEKLMATIERDGLPLYLLKKKLPMIETDINTLLSGFLDKTLVLRVDEKDVVVGMEVDTRITNYLGGMESFIIDLSLKLGFSKFANLPRSNFFIIDEGISVMDQERIGNISYLFDFLSQITDHVFLISHLPTIKDFVHQSIEIMKDPNTQKSRLVVT
jgi:DNA repair exonuclease SbcCD ATPase subunit